MASGQLLLPYYLARLFLESQKTMLSEPHGCTKQNPPNFAPG